MWLRLLRGLLPCALLMAWEVSLAEAETPLTGPPLHLREAVARSLEANPDLAVFAYELRAQAGRAQQAGLAPNPELTIELEDALGTGTRSGLKAAQTTLSLRQILERGAREQRVQVSESARGLLDAELAEKRLDVAAETARRYVHVLADQAQLEVTHEATQLVAQTVEAAELRVRAAKAPAAELARAQAALARANLDHEHAEHELLTSRRQLAAQWGEAEPAFGIAAGDLLTLPDSAAFTELSQRCKSNPGLLKFVAEQRVRDAELRLAEQRRKPAWQVMAGVRHNNASQDVAGVFGVSIPLTWRDRGQGAIAEAQARADQVPVGRTAAEIRTLTQLFEWFQELKHARAEAETLSTQVLPRMQEALQQTEYAYARGRYGYIELVAAQRELLDIKRARIKAAADAHRFATEIDRLTGIVPGVGSAQ